MASLSKLSQASRDRTGTIPGVLEQTTADHHKIVSALRARHPDQAHAAMLAHLENVEQRLVSIHDKDGSIRPE
jgi:DNA-binding FadR family transcriptional regulator